MPSNNVMTLNPKNLQVIATKKRPGLKPGQKIRATKKITPIQIQTIVLYLRSRCLDKPIEEVSYKFLSEKYEYSTVTLRNKPAISMAMEELRAAIEAANRQNTGSKEEEISESERIEHLISEGEQKDATISNYEMLHQALSIWFLARGQSFAQVIAEAIQGLNDNSPATDELSKSLVLPIYRR